MTNFVETCRFCGNELELDNTIKHQNCYEFYEFVLEEIIEKLKIKLDICLKIKKERI
jgi:hypothetical protein